MNKVLILLGGSTLGFIIAYYLGGRNNSIIHKLNKIMATLDEILADVTEEGTVIASLSTLTAGIKKQLDDVLAGNLPPGVQEKVDAIFAGVEANKAAAAKAITDNTPAEPPTT